MSSISWNALENVQQIVMSVSCEIHATMTNHKINLRKNKNSKPYKHRHYHHHNFLCAPISTDHDLSLHNYVHKYFLVSIFLSFWPVSCLDLRSFCVCSIFNLIHPWLTDDMFAVSCFFREWNWCLRFFSNRRQYGLICIFLPVLFFLAFNESFIFYEFC